MNQVTDVDYQRLERLLAEKRWQEADAETMIIMLKVANRQDRGYIGARDAKTFPIADLQRIDALWMKHSKGQFGFGVQKQLWHQAQRNYTEFADLIGWRQHGSWLQYGQLSFDDSACVGHLPALMFPLPMPGGGEVSSFVLGKWRVELLSRHDIRRNQLCEVGS
jgi:hypothetical protein